MSRTEEILKSRDQHAQAFLVWKIAWFKFIKPRNITLKFIIPQIFVFHFILVKSRRKTRSIWLPSNAGRTWKSIYEEEWVGSAEGKNPWGNVWTGEPMRYPFRLLPRACVWNFSVKLPYFYGVNLPSNSRFTEREQNMLLVFPGGSADQHNHWEEKLTSAHHQGIAPITPTVSGDSLFLLSFSALWCSLQVILKFRYFWRILFYLALDFSFDLFFLRKQYCINSWTSPLSQKDISINKT